MVELAQLIADPGFGQRVRGMAVAGATSADQRPVDPALVREHAGHALAAGIAPESPEGRLVLDRIVAPAMDRDARSGLAEQLETFTDRRVERYWELMGLLNGWPPFPSTTPAFEWLIAAFPAQQ